LHHHHSPHTPHPFPTRRSSDLERQRIGRAEGGRVGRRHIQIIHEGGTPARWRDFGIENLGKEEVPEFVLRTSPFGGATAIQLPIDRKSTRLNSSHLGISYAVFC